MVRDSLFTTDGNEMPTKDRGALIQCITLELTCARTLLCRRGCMTAVLRVEAGPWQALSRLSGRFDMHNERFRWLHAYHWAPAGMTCTPSVPCSSYGCFTQEILALL